MLNDPSGDESRVLSAFTYQENSAVLHRDPAQMPRRPGAWAAWNYLAGKGKGFQKAVSLTYWMNKLQNVDYNYPLFVTMNPLVALASDLVFKTFSYSHPVFDLAAVDAQAELPLLQGQNRTWFCGSYCGYGFHEDGLKAGIAVARGLGVEVPWETWVEPANHKPSPNVNKLPKTQPSLAAGE